MGCHAPPSNPGAAAATHSCAGHNPAHLIPLHCVDGPVDKAPLHLRVEGRVEQDVVPLPLVLQSQAIVLQRGRRKGRALSVPLQGNARWHPLTRDTSTQTKPQYTGRERVDVEGPCQSARPARTAWPVRHRPFQRSPAHRPFQRSPAHPCTAPCLFVVEDLGRNVWCRPGVAAWVQQPLDVRGVGCRALQAKHAKAHRLLRHGTSRVEAISTPETGTRGTCP